MKDRLINAAKKEGLPFGERIRTFNSRLAQELGKWAESKGRGGAFHDAAFKAYFVNGVNIGKIPELLEIVSSSGLPRDEAEAILGNRTFKKQVDEDWLLAKKTGITAIPTLVMNNDKLVGAQPYGMMTKFMEAMGVKKRQNR